MPSSESLFAPSKHVAQSLERAMYIDSYFEGGTFYLTVHIVYGRPAKTILL
jgi:hypothetical protein